MESIKRDVNEIMTALSEVVMLNEPLEEYEIRSIYKKLNKIKSDIQRLEEESGREEIVIPKLPDGNEFNGYPRILFALICEKYSKDEFFTISDMVTLTGSSRNQVKMDLTRLEASGFIEYISGYTGDHKTRFYKYKPINLVN